MLDAFLQLHLSEDNFRLQVMLQVTQGVFRRINLLRFSVTNLQKYIYFRFPDSAWLHCLFFLMKRWSCPSVLSLTWSYRAFTTSFTRTTERRSGISSRSPSATTRTRERKVRISPRKNICSFISVFQTSAIKWPCAVMAPRPQWKVCTM